jgi:hypothetical protein
MENNTEENKKPDGVTNNITLTHLMVACITILGGVLGFWKGTDVRLTTVEVKLQQQEIRNGAYDENNKTVNLKLDHLQETTTNGLNEIKVAMQNKADRK